MLCICVWVCDSQSLCMELWMCTWLWLCSKTTTNVRSTAAKMLRIFFFLSFCMELERKSATQEEQHKYTHANVHRQSGSKSEKDTRHRCGGISAKVYVRFTKIQCEAIQIHVLLHLYIFDAHKIKTICGCVSTVGIVSVFKHSIGEKIADFLQLKNFFFATFFQISKCWKMLVHVGQLNWVGVWCESISRI